MLRLSAPARHGRSPMSPAAVGLEAGTLYRYEAKGDLADKATYDDRPKGFAFLVDDVNPARLYIKASRPPATGGAYSATALARKVRRLP